MSVGPIDDDEMSAEVSWLGSAHWMRV